MSLPERVLWEVAGRPYVFALLVPAAWAGVRWLGARRFAASAAFAYLVAWGAEACSIRWNAPFGYYRYTAATAGREVWLAGVPTWDTVSFVSLATVSAAIAASALDRPLPGAGGRWLRFVLLAAVVMTLADVAVDPVTLQGSRWFLGQVYYYRSATYLGVPWQNFAGWGVVAATIVGGWSAAGGLARATLPPPSPRVVLVAVCCFIGVAFFMTAVAVALREWSMTANAAAIGALVPAGLAVGRARRQPAPAVVRGA